MSYFKRRRQKKMTPAEFNRGVCYGTGRTSKHFDFTS